MAKDLRKKIIKALEKKPIKNDKCLDCVGFCNFGKYPYCKPTTKKWADG